jgi:hypothetical protein
MTSRIHRISVLAGVAGVAGLLLFSTGCRRTPPGTFATPEEAAQRVHDLAGAGDAAGVEEVFGPGSMDMFRSDDPAQDKEAAAKVRALIEEKVAFEDFDDHTKVALFGDKAWPFPIPLVKSEDRWRFDTAAGREELLNRRIGYNELSTLGTLHAYVDAQFEYHRAGHDGLPAAFAQRVESTEGKHDGLYWAAAEGEEESPLGDLLAGAAALNSPDPQPFNGYYYRILTSQGKNAPGGEKSYLDKKGLMTGGFAGVAWPAKYGNSGVMTFLISHRDIVFQKDLGPGTAEAAAAITSFDPDPTWAPTGDSIDEVAEDGDSGDDAGDTEGSETD